MHNNQLFSFTDFKKANNDPATSGIDYVQAVYTTTPLHFDFLLHYAQLTRISHEAGRRGR
ncbi:hypothetical protein EQ831_24900 [Pseudomonas sp. ALS1279]|nr:hypothetical protein EQ831_24900 [Pseudomonas sp. ALS1279]